MTARLGRWLFTPIPLARFAAFRTLVYAFIFIDVVFMSGPARSRAAVSPDLYVPLTIARVLPFPTPTHAVVTATFWALLVLAPIAAFGRRPRLLGAAVFVLYLEWMLIAMSYGKVDHDRLGILVALALLPTVGRARHGDPTESEAAGWVFRMVQLAVIATYFLAACAKMRFGGIGWLWGGTLGWAIERRGTMWSNWLLQLPLVLVFVPIGMVAFEALSPLIFFVKESAQRKIVVGFYVFHVITIMALKISFAPHLIAMTSFLPLERVTPIRWVQAAVRRPVADAPLPVAQTQT